MHLKLKLRYLKARTKTLLARAERYNTVTSSETTSVGDYNITQCVTILQIIEGLDNEKYIKIVEKFTSLEWREIFMNMLDERTIA